MPAVALIQDGTEVGRQWFGDVVGHLQRCCERLSDNRYSSYSLRVFTDEDLGFLLEGIDPAEWSCLVFASNSLNSGRIEYQLNERRDKVDRFIASGGGVVVLHQVRDSFGPLLPADLDPGLSPRAQPRGQARAMAPDPHDVLLNFPESVDWPILTDLGPGDISDLRRSGAAVELPSLYFMAMGTQPAKLKPVLVSGDEVVAMRSREHLPERVVIVTIPLDWYEHRARQGVALSRLLANAIRYASVGVPRRLIWRERGSTRNELLLRWLSSDGQTVIHEFPEDQISGLDRWLLSTVDVLAMAPERRASVEDSSEVSEFLGNGGVLLSSSAESDLPASRVTALVGRFEQRTLIGRLTAELRSFDGWRTIDSAFDIRNIVSAIHFVQSQPVGALNVPPIALNELDNLIPLLTSRLSEEQHREDLGSSIALAQTMAHLKDPEPIDDSLIDWMADAARGRPFPVELHVRALLMACGRRRDPAFVKDVVKALDQNSATFRSPAPVARVLEAIALLDQFELIEANATDIARLTEQICGELRRFAELPDRGWISAESTGHIALGLVALYRALPLEWTEERSELAGHIATAAAALNRGRSAYQRGPKGVAVLARTIQALIVIDQWFPLGLQRFTSLEWPGGTSVGSGDRVERELTQHLAIQNEHLRQAQRDAESRLHELEGQLRERRIPTYVGQATATLLPTLALFAATWFVIQAIGWDSIAGLIANLAVVLSILVTVLAGLYGILARRRLLLTPADRLREWVATIGLPAIRDAGKVKRQ